MGTRLQDINKTCLELFRRHWECLEQNNQQMWHCRRKERKLNECVFEKLVCSSTTLCAWLGSKKADTDVD